MRRLFKDEKGSVLEFVITVPLLLALILIGIMFIMLSYSKIAVNIAARDSAREYAVTAHEITDPTLREENAKDMAVNVFQDILPLKYSYINKDDVVISTFDDYVTVTVTAYVPAIAPGMGKIIDKNSPGMTTTAINVTEGEEVRTINVVPIKASAVFKEEIDINS